MQVVRDAGQVVRDAGQVARDAGQVARDAGQEVVEKASLQSHYIDSSNEEQYKGALDSEVSTFWANNGLGLVLRGLGSGRNRNIKFRDHIKLSELRPSMSRCIRIGHTFA